MYIVHLHVMTSQIRSKLEYKTIIDYIAPYRVYSKYLSNSLFECAFDTFYDRKKFINQIKKIYPFFKIKINDSMLNTNNPFQSSISSYMP